MEIKKCSECCNSYSLDNFREKKNQCKPCARKIQNENRRKRKQLTGNRFDPTRETTNLQKDMICELANWFTQSEIGQAFHMGQSVVSKVVRKHKPKNVK